MSVIKNVSLNQIRYFGILLQVMICLTICTLCLVCSLHHCSAPSFIFSRLDFCNFFINLPKKEIYQLQRLKNYGKNHFENTF